MTKQLPENIGCLTFAYLFTTRIAFQVTRHDQLPIERLNIPVFSVLDFGIGHSVILRSRNFPQTNDFAPHDAPRSTVSVITTKSLM